MRFFPVILMTFVLAGCQSQPIIYDVPGRHSHDRNAASIWPDLTAAVRNQGLSIVEADQASGRLVARLADYQPRGWAVCRPAPVIDRHDDKNRRDRGRPVDRQVDLSVQVQDADAGSDIKLRANFTERQINPFKNLPFRTRCQSTGELERALFDTIEGS